MTKESPLDKIARMSWKSTKELQEESKKINLDKLSQEAISWQQQTDSERVKKIMDIRKVEFEIKDSVFQSYELGLDEDWNIHTIKFYLWSDSFKLYISNYNITERVIPAQKWVTPEQHITQVKEIWFWSIQKKARSGYESVKSKNYYRIYLWQNGELTSFVRELIKQYHHEKLA